jgi:drug/metabolite transporter (DMT)-like permease
MLLGSVTFAAMAAQAKALNAEWDWQLVAMIRAFLAFLFALLLALVAGAKLVVWGPGKLWFRSITGSISMVCSFYAFKHLPISDVLTISNMFPIWVALLCWPLLHEIPSGSVWLSMASGLVGVYLIQQPRFAEGNFATLVVLVGSVTTALAMLGLHQLAYIDTRAVVVHFSAVATVFCAASFFLFERDPSRHNTLNGTTGMMLLGMGVTATVGQLCLTKAFTEGPPAKVSVVGLTQVIFGMGFDLLWFEQRFQWRTLAGIGLILAPTAWLLLLSAKGTKAPLPVDDAAGP